MSYIVLINITFENMQFCAKVYINLNRERNISNMFCTNTISKKGNWNEVDFAQLYINVD